MSKIYWIYSEQKEVRENYTWKLVKELGFSEEDVLWADSNDRSKENVIYFNDFWYFTYRKEANELFGNKQVIVLAGTGDWYPNECVLNEYNHKGSFQAVFFLTAWNPNLVYLSDKRTGNFLGCLEMIFRTEKNQVFYVDENGQAEIRKESPLLEKIKGFNDQNYEKWHEIGRLAFLARRRR